MADMADVAEKVTEVINTVADKAREYGEVARLMALIKAEEAKKQEYYYRLGKKYYELYKDAPASDLSEIMMKLINADEKIADYKEDLKVASAKAETEQPQKEEAVATPADTVDDSPADDNDAGNE